MVLRGVRDGDWGLILNSWKLGAREFLAWVPGSHYFPWIQDHITHLRDHATWLVACNDDDSDFIHGWACYELDPNVVHFVYVRKAFRLNGIAALLLSQVDPPLRCTYWTRACEQIASTHLGWLRYQPSLRGSYD